MTDAPLFDVPESLSPRLAWIKKHEVKTKIGEGGVCPETGQDVRNWSAWDSELSEFDHFEKNGPASMGWGYTEDEAIVSLAVLKGWKMWNEEGAAD